MVSSRRTPKGVIQSRRICLAPVARNDRSPSIRAKLFAAERPFSKIANAPADPVLKQVSGVERDVREAAEAFVKTSPYLQACLFDDVRIYEYENEVG